MDVDTTASRIVWAALELFLSRGVKHVSVTDVAYRAGITRVTVYRHFGDKRRLAAAVCERIAAIFQRAAEAAPDDSIREIDARLNRLGMELSDLPQGNLLARLEEISRLYPDIYQEFRSARQTAVDTIFQQVLAAATREGTIREELNPDVLKAIFWAAVVGLIEDPALISSNVPLSEVFATVTGVFRHGILRESVEGIPYVQV
jgi:AcrR family transcriptional regulator